MIEYDDITQSAMKFLRSVINPNSEGKTKMKSDRAATNVKTTITPLPVTAFTPETAQEMADSISKIATGMKAIFQSRLSRKMIETLIAKNSNVAIDKIRLVLNNLEQFEEIWLNPKLPNNTKGKN